MNKHLKNFFAALLPILKTAGLEFLADIIHSLAYPSGPRRMRPANYYNRYQPRMNSEEAVAARRVGRNPFENRRRDMNTGKVMDEPFHDVLMVAFDIRGKNRVDVERWLEEQMPEVGENGDAGEIDLDSWWIADDGRLGRSDTHSAVFVNKGNQEAARKLLRERGLTH